MKMKTLKLHLKTVKQIIQKNYAKELQALGITNIVNVVAVFDKKDVKVDWFY